MELVFHRAQEDYAVCVEYAGRCFVLTDDKVLVLFVFLGPWLSP